jgi:hypothetical protein
MAEVCTGKIVSRKLRGFACPVNVVLRAPEPDGLLLGLATVLGSGALTCARREPTHMMHPGAWALESAG